MIKHSLDGITITTYLWISPMTVQNEEGISVAPVYLIYQSWILL